MAARHALLEACLSVSPRLEDAAPGLVHVDLAGLERVFGDPGLVHGDLAGLEGFLGDAAALGRRLRLQAHAVGLEARVGIAGSRAAAGVAARVGSPVHVVPPGAERAVLGAVPLTALECPVALAATFARWGLVTLGDLAALPRADLGARLGRAGLAAHDLAAGVDRAPFRAWTPPPFWAEAQGLDWEIATVPAMVPVLERVLARLCARLAGAQLLIDVLEVRLALATGGHHTRSVALAAPLGEVAPIVSLLALDIEAHPPPAAVIGVALSARVVPRRAAPGGLWQPSPPAPRDLAAVLTRLTLLVGGANVGTPVVVDSHRPDDYTLVAFAGGLGDGAAASGGDDDRSASRSGAGSLALRRVRPPRRVEVETREVRPIRVRDTSGLDTAVETSAGPWRLSGRWWDTDAWAHDEWDVELADHTLWRLAHDRRTDTWALTALYD
jgi:protein ImuB